MDLSGAQNWWQGELEKLPQVFSFIARMDLSVDAYPQPNPEDEYLDWCLYLFDDQDQPIHRPFLPLHRMIYESFELRGAQGRGRVLFNDLTCLSPGYQGRGLGKYLAALDERFSKEFGLLELQLNASCEALKNNHWQEKHKFVPSLNAQALIQEDWDTWCESGSRGVGTINAADWLSLPEDFRRKLLKPNFANSEQQMLELYKAVS